jgi:hypothetical protein
LSAWALQIEQINLTMRREWLVISPTIAGNEHSAA